MSDTDRNAPHHRLRAPRIDRVALCDTAAHAAVTALVVTAHVCPEPVSRHRARSLLRFVTSSAAGDGEPARRRAGSVVVLTAAVADAEPAAASLVLALERWLLHPGRDSATELTAAAKDFTADAPEELCRRAWLAGAGLDFAVDAVASAGLRGAPPEAVSLIGAAIGQGVPMVWVTQRCGVVRDGLYRRIRAVDSDAWLALAG